MSMVTPTGGMLVFVVVYGECIASVSVYTSLRLLKKLLVLYRYGNHDPIVKVRGSSMLVSVVET